jgi:NAD-dependent SIR2 family protein deacetylase
METQALREFIGRHSRLFVLTGAGCSTDSGIPDYRDAAGEWKRAQPVQFRAFMDEPLTRRRYWARSLVGWRRFGHAKPNDTHFALAALERHGRVGLLVTQNVDGLHQTAGSNAVVDLHGRLDTVRCMDCGARSTREEMQQDLLGRNPEWARLDARDAPDGDADLNGPDFSGFEVPDCCRCGGC